MKRLLLILLLFTATGAQAQRTIDLELQTLWSGVSESQVRPFKPTDTMRIGFFLLTHQYFAWKVKNVGTDSLMPGDTMKIKTYYGKEYAWAVDSSTGNLQPGDSMVLYPHAPFNNPVELLPGPDVAYEKVDKVTWCDTLFSVDTSGAVITDTPKANNHSCSPIYIWYWLGVNELKNNNAISVYPNPASDRLTISFKLNERGNVYIYIKDLSGKTVYEKALGQLSGEQKEELDLPELAKGMYLLQLRAGEELSTQKLLIE